MDRLVPNEEEAHAAQAQLVQEILEHPGANHARYQERDSIKLQKLRDELSRISAQIRNMVARVNLWPQVRDEYARYIAATAEEVAIKERELKAAKDKLHNPSRSREPEQRPQPQVPLQQPEASHSVRQVPQPQQPQLQHIPLRQPRVQQPRPPQVQQPEELDPRQQQIERVIERMIRSPQALGLWGMVQQLALLPGPEEQEPQESRVEEVPSRPDEPGAQGVNNEPDEPDKMEM